MTPRWIGFIPSPLRRKIEGRPNLQVILENTTWLFTDKLLRMAVGLLVGVWVARYLGPGQYGLLGFAGAIVALFGGVATLGLDEILVRDLIKDPDGAPDILGSAFTLRLLGGSIGFLLALLSVFFLRPQENLAGVVVAILGFAMIINLTGIVRFWFESRVQSKYTVWVQNGTFLVLSAVKIAMILIKASFLAFVWVAFAEITISTIGLYVVYQCLGGNVFSWRATIARSKNLLQNSWPLALSGLAIMLYMRIDQIMLGQMVSDDAVGIYSAALRISEIWYFIPVLICSSVFPTIIKAKKRDERAYNQHFQMLFDLVTLIAICIALPMTFLSSKLALLLFGPAFSSSGPVLAIHIWAGVFVFSGVVSSKWFLVEELQKLFFIRSIIGCLVNISLNFLLIPRFFAIGAASATVISQAMASVLMNAFYCKTRPVFFMQIKAFYFHSLIRAFYKMAHPPKLF